MKFAIKNALHTKTPIDFYLKSVYIHLKSFENVITSIIQNKMFWLFSVVEFPLHFGKLKNDHSKVPTRMNFLCIKKAFYPKIKLNLNT